MLKRGMYRTIATALAAVVSVTAVPASALAAAPGEPEPMLQAAEGAATEDAAQTPLPGVLGEAAQGAADEGSSAAQETFTTAASATPNLDAQGPTPEEIGSADAGDWRPSEHTGLQPVEFFEITEEEAGAWPDEETDVFEGAFYGDSYWDQYRGYYFYNKFNDAQKRLYDALDRVCVAAIRETKDYSTTNEYGEYALDRADYTSLSMDDAYEVACLFRHENPQYYFVSNRIGYGYAGSDYFIQLYCYSEFNTRSERKAANAAMKAQLESWLGEIPANGDMVSREKCAHDVIVRDIDYRSNALDQSSYSAIVNKSTVCAGYAGAISMLLNAAGIDAQVVTSDSHAWDIARINGSWYHVDATWDDTGRSGYRFLNRNASGIREDDEAGEHIPESLWTAFLPAFPRDSDGTGAVGSPAGVLGEPVITQKLSGSNYQITITGDGDSDIYYTTDGSDPGSCFSKSSVYYSSFQVKKGTTIKARMESIDYLDGPVATLTVGSTDQVRVTGISVSPASAQLYVGQSRSLTAAVTPSDASNRAVTWRSSDETVATVSYNGQVTAIALGSATITATTIEGGYADSASVMVIETPAPVPQPDTGVLQAWKATAEVPHKDQKKGVPAATLRVALDHTAAVAYDGRKHVVKTVKGKAITETASVNPDITIDGFQVTLDGEVLEGITIKSYSYKNNQLPSYDGVTDQAMYVFPAAQYDGKSAALKAALKAYPKLKTTLNKLLKPSFNSKSGWSTTPVTVEIGRIMLTSDTPVYTTADLKANKELQKKDGILVWNGEPYRKNLKWTGLGNEDACLLLDVTFKGLYYQRVFQLPGGKTSVKKLSLRAGKWKYHRGSAGVYLTMGSNAFDYYMPPMIVSTNDLSFTSNIALNGDPDVDWAAFGNRKAKLGYFTGTLPSIVW